MISGVCSEIINFKTSKRGITFIDILILNLKNLGLSANPLKENIMNKEKLIDLLKLVLPVRKRVNFFKYKNYIAHNTYINKRHIRQIICL